ncbi:hypothetical protein GN316_10295 [Xylophilus sp. Kf1]|nr:hypothetical protein [Xylophilus sp. Kf1]
MEASEADGGIYDAKYAYVRNGWIFLRIYRRGCDEILAERLYYSGDRAKFFWLKDIMAYNTASDDWPHDGTVVLPPTPMDRLLTYLP